MEEIARFLSQYPPFNLISPDQVRHIASAIQTRSFAASQNILIHRGKPADQLYIVCQGSVDLLREDKSGTTSFDTLGPGECFGHVSLIRRKPPRVTVRTREATRVYCLPAPLFHQLCRDIPAIGRFFALAASERLTTMIEPPSPGTADALRLRLKDLTQRTPVTIPPDAPVRKAAQLMHEQNTSCLIVTSRPEGILTDSDLRNRVLAAGLSDSTPVAKVMTTPVQSLPADSLLFEALLLMLKQGLHHLPITENARIVGIVTQADMLRPQSHSPLILPHIITHARSFDDLLSYPTHIIEMIGMLLDTGVRIGDIGRLVAAAHDALVVRLLQDAEAELGPSPCPYAWLVLGSEGRYEQTLHTDQDNALIYVDDAPPDADTYFAALAERVVQQLVLCGFPLCKGNIMATNSEWRQPLLVWKGYFTNWIERPSQDALLHAATFFDYRPLYGNLEIEAPLRSVIDQGRTNRIFLARLARAALRQPAPLDFRQQIVLEYGKRIRDSLDLKQRGTALIVDMARLFALEAGCSATSTLTRLRLSVGQSSLAEANASELATAFELISLFRLRHQYEQHQRGEPTTNQIVIPRLNRLEQEELKEALIIVANNQRGVQMSFQTALIAG